MVEYLPSREAEILAKREFTPAILFLFFHSVGGE